MHVCVVYLYIHTSMCVSPFSVTRTYICLRVSIWDWMNYQGTLPKLLLPLLVAIFPATLHLGIGRYELYQCALKCLLVFSMCVSCSGGNMAEISWVLLPCDLEKSILCSRHRRLLSLVIFKHPLM